MRSRNIKPGFFKNAELAQLPAVARLLFIGLWCMADREGRLLDRPMQIKLEVLPIDEVDINELLTGLEKNNFLVRYSKDGLKYISINNFNKHQFPHHREQASLIPAPGKPRASLGKAHLIPDILIPDILIPVKRKAFEKPTPEQVSAYGKEIGFGINGHEFVNHYEASGWMRGKTKISNWKACVRTWKTRSFVASVNPAHQLPQPVDEVKLAAKNAELERIKDREWAKIAAGQPQQSIAQTPAFALPTLKTSVDEPWDP